jgi:Asp-tRNA(Asn)/Glu-tRNA(Gln) amidotransferase A subunit family amidase
MARSIRDLSLAFSQLAGPDGQDGYSSSAVPFDNSIVSSNKHPLRVGWLVEPGFGPVDRETAANSATNKHDFLVALEAAEKIAREAEQEAEDGRPSPGATFAPIASGLR